MSILDSFSLEGKTALVTGANRGIGQAVAVGLAEAGADVVGLNRGENAAETEQRITEVGRSYWHIQADLETAGIADFDGYVQRAKAETGRLDILVNNAGIIRRSPALEFPEEDWRAVLQVNLNAVFYLAQAAANEMLTQGGGKIINIASLLSFQGGIFVPAYTAAKHGVLGVTRALANELAQHHINVNAIAPGYIATDNTAALRADETRNRAIKERIPAGDWGQPEVLQGAAVFLASAASDYMHGSTVTVDGGWMGR